MKIAIVMPTYRKKDGSTLPHLTRALESIRNQTHNDYKVFLIGDDYTDQDELIEVSKIIDEDKIMVHNLPHAYERNKYVGKELWVCGGTVASNKGIDLALSEGYSYICYLDHDDWYTEDHLALISKTIEDTGTNFVTTRCGTGWPAIASTQYIMKYRPLPSKLFKSTACVNHKYFGLRFRNMIEECNRVYAGDADLWARINKILVDKNEWGYLIDESTMGRGTSQTVISNPDIV